MRMASLPCGANRHQLAPTPDTPPPRPPQREEQRGTQRNSWGLLVCTTCFRPSIEWGWPACRRTAVHIAPLCSTSPNALSTERNSEAPSGKAGGSYSRNLVFRVSEQVGWPACCLTATCTTPCCAHPPPHPPPPPPPSSQRGAARPPAKQLEARIVPDCKVLPNVLPLSSGIPCIKITL